jgi:hypothetical protein
MVDKKKKKQTKKKEVKNLFQTDKNH